MTKMIGLAEGKFMKAESQRKLRCWRGLDGLKRCWMGVAVTLSTCGFILFFIAGRVNLLGGLAMR
jgi:hypothetical protein